MQHPYNMFYIENPKLKRITLNMNSLLLNLISDAAMVAINVDITITMAVCNYVWSSFLQFFSYVT